MTTSDINADPIEEALRLKHGLRSAQERRWLRVRAGLSQEALGEAIGVSQGTLARWESGLRTPRSFYLRRYVEALDRLSGGGL